METQGSQFFENIVQTARNYVNKIIVFYKNKLQNADNKPMFITIVNSLISAKNIIYHTSLLYKRVGSNDLSLRNVLES